MVKIPESYGTKINLGTQPTTAVLSIPDTNQDIVASVKKLGDSIINFGMGQALLNKKELAQKQLEHEQFLKQDRKEYEDAMFFDAQSQLQSVQNDEKIKFAEIPAINGKEIDNAKNNSFANYDKVAQSIANQFTDDPKLFARINQEIESERIQFKYAMDNAVVSKNKEYKTNVFYKSIDNYQRQYEKGANFNKINNQIQALYAWGLQSNIINQQDINRQNQRIQAINIERQKQFLQTQEINKVLSGSVIIDPSNSDDKKIAEIAFDKAIKQGSENGMGIFAIGKDFIKKTNYIPQKYQSFLYSNLVTGSDENKVQAAQFIATLPPKLQTQFSNENLHYAINLTKNVSLGIDFKKAIEYTDAQQNKNKTLDYQLRLNTGKNYIKRQSNNTEDNNVFSYKNIAENLNFNPSSFATEYQPATLKYKISENFKDIFLKELANNPESTPESALEVSKNIIATKYSPTSVGRPRIMEYSPESYYKDLNNGNTDWIQMQFEKLLKQNNSKIKNRKINDEYTLIPIASTTKTNKPAYYVIYTGDEEKVANFVTKKNSNQKLIFVPDLTKTDFYANDKKLNRTLLLEKYKEDYDI